MQNSIKKRKLKNNFDNDKLRHNNDHPWFNKRTHPQHYQVGSVVLPALWILSSSQRSLNHFMSYCATRQVL